MASAEGARSRRRRRQWGGVFSIFELKKASFGAFCVLEIPDWGCKYPFAHFQGGGQVPPLPMPGGARVASRSGGCVCPEIVDTPICIIPNRNYKPNPQYSHVLCVHCSAVAALHPAGRATALAPPCLLLCFGNSVNRKQICLQYLTALFVLF